LESRSYKKKKSNTINAKFWVQTDVGEKIFFLAFLKGRIPGIFVNSTGFVDTELKKKNLGSKLT